MFVFASSTILKETNFMRANKGHAHKIVERVSMQFHTSFLVGNWEYENVREKFQRKFFLSTPMMKASSVMPKKHETRRLWHNYIVFKTFRISPRPSQRYLSNLRNPQSDDDKNSPVPPNFEQADLSRILSLSASTETKLVDLNHTKNKLNYHSYTLSSPPLLHPFREMFLCFGTVQRMEQTALRVAHLPKTLNKTHDSHDSRCLILPRLTAAKTRRQLTD